ncbi:MAG: hypothetical protein J0L60_13965 [Ignavibacteria bacterium]|nr:hypothetical protein [Ignavibacteria bacterium]
MKTLFLCFTVLLIIQSTGCSDKKSNHDAITKSVISQINNTDSSDFLNIYFHDPSKIKTLAIDTISSFVQNGDTAVFSGMITLQKTVLPEFSSKFIRNEILYPFEEKIRRKFEASVETKDSLYKILYFRLDQPHILTVANNKQTVDDFFKKNRISSIKKVLDLIAKAKEEFKDASQDERDYLFCLIYQRMKALAKSYKYDASSGDAGWARFESNTRYGYSIGGEEGYSWLEINYEFLSREFSKFISDDLMIFINVFKLQHESQFSGADAYLSDLITPEERLKRLIQIEDYFKRNKQSLLQDEIEALYGNLFTRLFRTFHQTPQVESISQVKGTPIDPKLKPVFLEAEKKYPETFTGAFAKEYNKILVKNNYLLTDEVISFLKSKNLI